MLKQLSILIFSALSLAPIFAQTSEQYLEVWDKDSHTFFDLEGNKISGKKAQEIFESGEFLFPKKYVGYGQWEFHQEPIPPEKEKLSKTIDWKHPKLSFYDKKGNIIPFEWVKPMVDAAPSFNVQFDTLEDGSINGFITNGTPKQKKINYFDTIDKEIEEWKSTLIGTVFPDFELKDMEGKTVSNSDLFGNVVVVNFWYSQCGHCIREFKGLNAMKKVYENDPVMFLAPNFECKNTIVEALKKWALDFQVLPQSYDLIKKLGIDYYPCHMILDKKGTIKDITVGYTEDIGKDTGKKINWLLKYN